MPDAGLDAGTLPGQDTSAASAAAAASAPEAAAPPAPAPAPAAPAGAEACEAVSSKQLSCQRCSLPCLLPRPSAKGKRRRQTNPVIVLCQKDYCQPFTVGCPPGKVFDGESSCVSPTEVGPNQPRFAAERESAEQARSMENRLRHRMRPRLTLEHDLGLGFIAGLPTHHVNAYSARVLVGYRIHYRRQLGLQLRAGIRLGAAELIGEDPSDPWRSSADSSVMTGIVLEAMPVFGPYGRFYLGPIGQVGYVGYEKNMLRAGISSVSLGDGFMAGAGVHGGVAFSDTERFVLHFSIIVAHQNGLAVLGTLGIGLHL